MSSSTEFLDLGQHCSEVSCHQLDFLPFKCPSCSLPFCADHWRPPNGHKCSSYDEAAVDNRIPSCPLCLAPVSYPVNSDPNLAMDRHLSTVCPKLNPDAPVIKPKNVCQERRCKTKMIVPIPCTDCQREFCAKHRWGRDHDCDGKPVGQSTGKNMNIPAVAYVSRSGIAALRRAQQAVANAKHSGPRTPHHVASKSSSMAAPASSSSNQIVIDSDSDSDVQIVESSNGAKFGKLAFSDKSRGKQALTGLGLGSKTDKRALAEQESAKRALEARAKKGLLTENEKLRYATLKALDQKKGSKTKDGDGCTMC